MEAIYEIEETFYLELLQVGEEMEWRKNCS